MFIVTDGVGLSNSCFVIISPVRKRVMATLVANWP